jgi:hypothetical protein
MEALRLRDNESHFWPRSYQQRFKGAFARQEYDRFFKCWHRRAGKDDDTLDSLIQFIALEEIAGRIGGYWYIWPTVEEARRGMWKNICGHKIRQIDHVPEALRGEPWPNEGDMILPFRGGSQLWLTGGKFPDRLRGPNPRGVVLTEWARMNPMVWDVVEPIIVENKGWAVFQTTPAGNNHAALMWRKAEADPTWFTDLRTIADTRRDARGEDGGPVIDSAALDRMRRDGKSEEFLLQEYYCSWAGVMMGSYWGLEIETARADMRITHVPHEPQLPVHTFWDLGWRNAMVVWFVQYVGRQRRVIDCLAQVQGGLPTMIAALQQGHRRAYVYGKHWAPHDIKVHELGTEKSRDEVAASLGVKFERVPQIGFANGVEAVRSVLPRCWFDAARCERGLDALVSYHREYDEEREIYASSPYKDWTSDFADAFRMFAVAEADDRPAFEGPPSSMGPSRGPNAWEGV